MNTKKCWILDTSRNFQFYGTLNLDLVGAPGYNFYEISDSLIGKPLKISNGEVVIDYNTEYNNRIEYQKKAFEEYKKCIMQQISYVELLGCTSHFGQLENSTTYTDLIADLDAEITAYNNRVNAIVKEGS